MIFALVYFRALKRKPVICKSDNAFRFSRFLVPSRQRNHRKSFYCHGKYFAKENFRASAWTSAKCYCGNKTGNPERAVSLHLARSGSQSQRGIWFILPARGACHIISWVITNFYVVPSWPLICISPHHTLLKIRFQPLIRYLSTAFVTNWSMQFRTIIKQLTCSFNGCDIEFFHFRCHVCHFSPHTYKRQSPSLRLNQG